MATSFDHFEDVDQMDLRTREVMDDIRAGTAGKESGIWEEWCALYANPCFENMGDAYWAYNAIKQNLTAGMQWQWLARWWLNKYGLLPNDEPDLCSRAEPPRRPFPRGKWR